MKTGFIYLWYDRKHKRFYIGCHVGKEDDGYICSSSWMKKAYKYRPEDFKRRILKRDIPRSELLAEEYKWLDQIKDDELGTKYYNLSKRHFGHWSNDINNRKTIGQKISERLNSKEVRKKLSDSKIGKNNPMKRPEVVEKRLDSFMKREDRSPWNKDKKIGPNPEHSERMKGRISPNKGKKMSKESRNKMSKMWKIIHPNGREEIIINLKEFCMQHNLADNNMRKVAQGQRMHCSNFKCFYV